MAELASVSVERCGEIQLVRLAGEVDISNASKLEADISEAVPNGTIGLVLDLSDTQYLDSAGIHMLFELRQRLAGRRQSFAAVVPAEALIRHALVVAEVDQVLDIQETVVEALDLLRTAASRGD
jgi:anti-sigma B factor antagonist